MKNLTKNFFLFLGLAVVIIGIIIWYFNLINTYFLIFFIIAGIVSVVIGMYNWKAGEDMSKKQEYPIENADLDFRKF